METNLILSILVITSLILLVVVSGGVLYLTSVEWRDRRQQEQLKREKRSQR